MKLQDQSFNISGTYNIDRHLTAHARSLLLPDGRVEFFLCTAERDMYTIGPPTFTHDEYDSGERGYGGEWYFKASSGNVVAIGFRWNTPRLRGTALTTVNDVVELIDFLQSELPRR